MSRPSRGFTVTHASGGTVVVCPSAAVLVLNEIFPDVWSLLVTWSPDVLVGLVGLNFQVNGGGFTNFDTRSNVHSGQTWFFDPNNFGGAGDLLEFQIQCVGIVGCSAFVSNIVGDIIA